MCVYAFPNTHERLCFSDSCTRSLAHSHPATEKYGPFAQVIVFTRRFPPMRSSASELILQRAVGRLAMLVSLRSLLLAALLHSSNGAIHLGQATGLGQQIKTQPCH